MVKYWRRRSDWQKDQKVMQRSPQYVALVSNSFPPDRFGAVYNHYTADCLVQSCSCVRCSERAMESFQSLGIGWGTRKSKVVWDMDERAAKAKHGVALRDCCKCKVFFFGYEFTDLISGAVSASLRWPCTTVVDLKMTPSWMIPEARRGMKASNNMQEFSMPLDENKSFSQIQRLWKIRVAQHVLASFCIVYSEYSKQIKDIFATGNCSMVVLPSVQEMLLFISCVWHRSGRANVFCSRSRQDHPSES